MSASLTPVETEVHAEMESTFTGANAHQAGLDTTANSVRINIKDLACLNLRPHVIIMCPLRQ